MVYQSKDLEAGGVTWYSFLRKQIDKNMKLQSHISDHQKYQFYRLHREFQIKNRLFKEEVKAKQNFQLNRYHGVLEKLKEIRQNVSCR